MAITGLNPQRKNADMKSRQLFMDLINNHNSANATSLEEGPADGPRRRQRQCRPRLQRAVLAWLFAENAPRGAAVNVPTRIARFKADVAAFWSKSVHNRATTGPARILKPTSTMLVQCHATREECWGDMTRSDSLQPTLEQSKKERRKLEEQIREEEPELRDPNTLFEEYAVWNYDESRNQRYHKLLRDIKDLEYALLEGTRFEQIRSAGVADQLYLAVPARLIAADELADGWGLLWVHENLQIEVRRAAVQRDCDQSSRQHIIQNIAAAATDAVLFQNGICNPSDKPQPYFVQKPRGHRKPKTIGLSEH